MIDCYKNIVGFTQQDCECLSSDRPADYNESKSGLFFDGLKPLSDLQGLANCDENFWKRLERTRDDSIKNFVADTNALLGTKHRLKRKAYTGAIGQVKSKEIHVNNKNYAVLRLACAPVKSGVLKINGIGTVFTDTGTVEVSLYSNLDGLISTHTLNTVADTHTENDLDIELSLYSKYYNSTGLEYYLVYQFTSNMPKDTEVDCGCGGGWIPKYNKKYPYYAAVGRHRDSEWADWLMVGGCEVYSVTELDDLPETASNRVYGLTLDIEIKCKVSEVLCSGALDFVGNPLAMSMAYAIYYKWGFLMAESVLNSSDLNRDNMVNNDALEASQIYWNEKYNEAVNHIVDNADIKANDCFTCKKVLNMTREGLFS